MCSWKVGIPLCSASARRRKLYNNDVIYGGGTALSGDDQNYLTPPIPLVPSGCVPIQCRSSPEDRLLRMRGHSAGVNGTGEVLD